MTGGRAIRWRPAIPLEEGLRRSIAWFSARSRLAKLPLTGP